MAEELNTRGYPIVPDQNGTWEDGVMPVTCSVDERQQRVTCAIAYLSPAVRARPNLRVMTETYVRRILFEGKRAVGAELLRGEVTERVEAAEVIVSCGSIHSPAMLMRSGVGRADEMGRHGVGTVHALAGVGRNLIEHPVVSISCYLSRAARLANLERHHTQAHLRFSSGVDDCPAGDMSLAIIARSGWHAVGQRVGSLYVWVNKSYSQGRVDLRSADPQDEPLVDFRMLSDERDLVRLRKAFRFVADLAASATLDEVRSTTFPIIPTGCGAFPRPAGATSCRWVPSR